MELSAFLIFGSIKWQLNQQCNYSFLVRRWRCFPIQLSLFFSADSKAGWSLTNRLPIIGGNHAMKSPSQPRIEAGNTTSGIIGPPRSGNVRNAVHIDCIAGLAVWQQNTLMVVLLRLSNPTENTKEPIGWWLTSYMFGELVEFHIASNATLWRLDNITCYRYRNALPVAVIYHAICIIIYLLFINPIVRKKRMNYVLTLSMTWAWRMIIAAQYTFIDLCLIYSRTKSEETLP